MWTIAGNYRLISHNFPVAAYRRIRVYGGDFSLNSQRIHGESAEVKEDIGFKAFAVAVAAGLLYE